MNAVLNLGELVDAHCHVDLYKDSTALARECDRFRVHTIGVTNAPMVFAHTEALGRTSRYLHPAIGLHPELVHSHGHQLPALLEHIRHVRFVGEVGLDYVTRDAAVRARQRDVFTKVLRACADSGNRIVTVHSRRAAADVLSIVGRSFPGYVILHWFSGSTTELRRAVEADLYFSVNPAMVLGKRGADIVAHIPRDRLLTETDGPFVEVGRDPARPRDVRLVLQAVATLWQAPVEEVADVVRDNFRTVLNEAIRQ